MYNDGLYPIRHFAWIQHSTIVDLPLAIWNVPAGTQNEQCWHSHDSVELVLITAGTGRHVLNGKRAKVREGDVLVIYPGHKHGYEECQTLALTNLLYNSSRLPLPLLDGTKIPLFQRLFPEDLAQAARNTAPEPVLHFDNRDDLDAVLEHVHALEQELTTPLVGNILFSVVKLLDIILTILDLADARQPLYPEKRTYPLAAILEHINQNFTQKIDFGRLLKMSRLSQRVFQYKFKQLTGYSLTQYVLRKRLEFAKEQLARDAERPILDVAFDAGFTDLSYFTAQFRKHYAITPRKFQLQTTKRTLHTS